MFVSPGWEQAVAVAPGRTSGMWSTWTVHFVWAVVIPVLPARCGVGSPSGAPVASSISPGSKSCISELNLAK